MLVIVLVLVGCSDSNRTSLEGNIACGATLTCGSQEVCVSQGVGIDAAVPGPSTREYCSDVPADCALYDCEGAMCSACYDTALCGCLDCVVRVSGRNVECLGG